MSKIIIIFFLLTTCNVANEWRLVESFDNTSTWKYSDVESIHCYDSNNCYAIIQHSKVDDYGCRIYNSSDGGRLWYLIKTVSHDTPYILNVNKGVSPNTDYYFILSDDETFLEKSIDAGKTFKTKILDTDNHYPREIAMYDTNIGFVSNSNTIFTTKDGWETFERQPKLHTNQTYYSPVFLDSNTVGMIYGSPWSNSFGKGESYVKYYINENKWDTLIYFERDGNIWIDFIFGLYFVNDSLGYASGRQTNDSLSDGQYYDIIYKTTDGGHKWDLILKEYQYPYKGFYNNISFYDENNGIAVGFYGKIAMTNDGGDTWVYEPTPNEMDNCRKMLVCWAGRTPLIGTWDAGIFRYEGDFFKFPPDTTDVEEKEITNYELQITPNPAIDFIEINVGVQNFEPLHYLKIYNLFGECEIIYEFQITNYDENVRIDVRDLAAGMYFIRIGDNHNKFLKY